MQDCASIAVCPKNRSRPFLLADYFANSLSVVLSPPTIGIKGEKESQSQNSATALNASGQFSSFHHVLFGIR